MDNRTISQDALFRMSFVLQDSSATTTATYLQKLIESVLYKSEIYLSITDIKEGIYADFLLEFTELEIINAIKQGIRRESIIEKEKTYALSAQRQNFLSHTDSVESKLSRFISRFLQTKETTFTTTSFMNLFSRFLYHCFNKNKDALLCILDDRECVADRISFEATPDEIAIINEFLIWDNAEKDKLIYQIVSTCYAYCSLTVKNNELLSRRIFSNKKFYLDANIIFRMAGINRSERQKSVISFITNCRKLNIQLIFTGTTYAEIDRVITSKCGWLKGINENRMPLDISQFEQEDDFYEMYRKWCHEPQNKCGDFNAFSAYLWRLVNGVLSELTQENIPNYESRKREDFNNYCEILQSFKKRTVSQQSLSTDINNLLFIQEKRKNEACENVFSTSVFMISADQSLILFAKNNFEGIDIVVLPSVWLTIMLRFCGRTDDDYKAFISFMGIRTNDEASSDIYKILKTLTGLTEDDDIKRKVITEMQHNKEQYPVDDEDEYATSVKKAFDVIIAEKDAEKDKELEEQSKSLQAEFSIALQKAKDEAAKSAAEIEEKHKEEIRKHSQKAEDEMKKSMEEVRISAASEEHDRSITVLATDKAKRIIKSRKRWRTFFISLVSISVFLLLVTLFGWGYEWEFCERCFNAIAPKRFADSGDYQDMFSFFGVVETIVSFIMGAIVAWLNKICSAEIESELIEKETEKMKNVFSQTH